MEQYNNWEEFWQSWHKTEVRTEADLYYQVAKTINKEPIRKEIFDRINNDIARTLELSTDDVLVELCCGNGLCTYEFRDMVRQVIAVDYSEHLIETAMRLKSAPNITYCFESVFDFLSGFKKRWHFGAAKFLMNDSLAYFDPEGLEQILKNIRSISPGKFRFLVRGVPNDELKWNFYRTEEWKQKYLDGVAKGDFTNAGMGRWWQPAEIEDICRRLGMVCRMRDQQPPVSDYRMDVLITDGDE